MEPKMYLMVYILRNLIPSLRYKWKNDNIQTAYCSENGTES